MVKAYILVEVEYVEVNKVASEITEIEEIENANIIYGEYDIICLAKANSVIDLKEIVLQKVGKVKGVVNTSSLIVADEE